MTTYYKVLGPGRTACHGGTGTWPEPGGWLEVKGEVIPCRNGLHLTDLDHLIDWLGPEIWEAEVHPAATVIEHGDKIAVSKARLVRRLDAWDDRTARLFAADCAEHVLHLSPAAVRGAAALLSPYDAAWVAAWVAARAAAARAARAAAGAGYAAAYAAARDAEREWQTARLARYLGIEP